MLDDTDKLAWTELLQEHSNKDLAIIKDLIDSVIAARQPAGYIGIIFNQLRSAFSAGENPRFSSVHVSFFMPWEPRSEKQKKEFTKAWTAAVNSFAVQGFADNKALHQFIINLVVKSPLFQDSIEYATTIASLGKVQQLFEDQWPYSKTHQGREFIKGVLNGDTSSTTRRIEAERTVPAAVR